MSEPTVTLNYGWPRQIQGPASRERFNASLDAQDNTVALLANLLASLYLLTPHIKIYDPIIPSEGQTLVTLPEYFQYPNRRLIVALSGLTLSPGIHYTTPDDNHVLFGFPLHSDEVVQIVEIQLGDDSGAPPGLPPGQVQVAEEVPTGTIDSTDGVNGNGVFTLQHPVAEDTVPRVVVNHFAELTPNVHYTWANNVITFTAGAKPIVGETPVVIYTWRYL